MRKYARMLVGVSISVLALAQGNAALAETAADADVSADEPVERIIVTGTRANPLVVESPTGSRLNITPLETPATVNALDGDTIRARGDFDFIEAVTRAPGVTASQTPGDGNTSLSLRGFSGQGSVMHLFNGVRLLPVAGSITFPFDTWNVERIEVLNGPGSVLYGQGALGGVVNVIPKRANFEQFEAQARASYGSFDTFNVAGGVGGPIADSLAFRADASYRRSDGYVERGESESLAISGALEFRPSDSFALTLRHDFGDNQPMRYWGTPLADGTTLDTSIREKNYNVGDAVIDFRDNRTQLDLDWTPIDGVQVRNTAYYLKSDRQWENLESYFYDTAAGVVQRGDNFGIDHDVEQIGNQASVSYSGQLTPGISNQLLVGFDFNHLDLTYSHNFADELSDEVDPFNFDPRSFLNTVGIIPRYRTATQTFAIFVEDRLELGEKFSVIGGVRYEQDRVGRWNFARDGAGNIIGETPALNGGRSAYKTFDDVTWRVGAVYQPTPALSLYAQYVTGVDPIGTLTTYSGGVDQFEFSNATGNQIEAGVKSVFLDGNGSATLSVFRVVKNDLTFQRTTGGAIEQVGQQSSQGIEASVTVQLPAGFAVDANGTIIDANFDDFVSGGTDFTGNTPPGVPQTAGNVSLSWSGIDRFQLRSSLRYVGKRYTNNTNTATIPSYVVVDAGASVALTENFAVDLRVNNLFDKDYAIDNYGSQQWILGRPRSYEIALRTSF